MTLHIRNIEDGALAVEIPDFLLRIPKPATAGCADAYLDFLKAKIKLAPSRGFDVERSSLNQSGKPHCLDIVPWACKGGRRAIFAAFGLHKTWMQLEIMRQVGLRTGLPTLIVAPLDVRLEFLSEWQVRGFEALGMKLKVIRSTDEIEPGNVTHITNYEPVRDGKIDTTLFAGVSLDEAAVLRGFGGTKTFREFMRLFDTVKYRFVATATPSPNEYIELLAYAAFLDIMDVGQAKTRFFKRNSEQADELVIHPHKEREFWLWVSSWSTWIQAPSDLGYSDEGYLLPDAEVHWHEIPADHSEAGADHDGQQRLFKKAAIGVVDAAREKRESIDPRIAKMLELRSADADAHRIIWHDLEAERRAIEKALPDCATVYGSQDPDERADTINAFRRGEIAELGAKPVMLGSGGNLQYHCAWAIFLGIGFKFKDFIQAIYRLQRFGQTRTVRLDLIYTEAERSVREDLERKWDQDKRTRVRMRELIREYGLAQAGLSELQRTIGVERREVAGEGFRLINNDCVAEARSMLLNSVGMILTSIPFSQQYEYTPSYNDFGHTDDNAHFWAQMDFLIPELLRVLQPGRIAAIHVKDRIVPGGMTGLGFQTVQPFSDECVAAFRKHGFAFIARKTIVTDVVRENNQTYRLGWTEQCKDGSRMGAGMPEYLLIFRKPPSDSSNGYADLPVVKEKPWCDDNGEPAPFDKKRNWKQPISGTGYSRGRWQYDAHGMMRSSGNRLLSSQEIAALPHEALYKLWRDRSTGAVYDFEEHVGISEEMDRLGRLPSTFMLFPPHSWHDDVWSDVARMRTLNGAQHAKGKEMHLCPLQFDIVDRAIIQYTMKGETVFDPFGGLMTVVVRALELGRAGIATELNPGYFKDGCWHVEAAAEKRATPSLFDLMGAEPETAE